MAYIKKAILLKKDHPTWSQMYQKMAMTELEHASTLMKIFEEDYKAEVANIQANGHTPIYLNECRKAIIEMYQEFASKVNYMNELYSKA